MPVIIDKEKCTGCGLCVKACPFKALLIVDKLAQVDEAACTMCGVCGKPRVCPFQAIEVRLDKAKGNKKLDEYRNIWVFAEQKKGVIQGVVYELLGKARTLADIRQQQVWAVLLGKNVGHTTQDLIARGADTVIIVDDPALDHFEDGAYSNVLTRLIKKYKPEAVLTGATSIGRSLIPRVAVQIGTGLTADCTGLDIDSETGLLRQTRPAFGGNIMATIHLPEPPAADGDRAAQGDEGGAARSNRAGRGDQGSVRPERQLLAQATCSRRSTRPEDTVNIAEASIIISPAAAALKKPENFALLHDLAKAVGRRGRRSRAAVDAGWIPYSHQVGQTGKTVSPKIYIACGISGQIQHLVGMQSADIIVAINKDPDAPMMKIATFALCGDLFEIIPEIIRQAG